MLKFKDKTGRVKFLLRDEDPAPVDVDQLVMEQLKKEEAKKLEEKNEASSSQKD